MINIIFIDKHITGFNEKYVEKGHPFIYATIQFCTFLLYGRCNSSGPFQKKVYIYVQEVISV